MAIIKCKMCGGDLVLVENQSTAECEYCGSIQTVPVADDEKKLTLFARANRLRSACEFDKAAGIYESIVADFPEEAEAYWGLVLCKFGIEYVDDPGTGKKIPTCHRSSFESLMEDNDYEQAIENADAVARKVYREEAKQIEELRRGIIEVSAKEEPYDIFICYKETAEDGNRTLDSVLAQDIYDDLTDKGYRVFFARITLEDKLGREYEPYIFAALNSAQIMLVVGTDYEYFNAVWVKNEWSRFLQLMGKDKSKHLIPCYKGIDAYDMPKEFARLQAQDMGKVGAMQDLLRGVEKLMPKNEVVQPIVIQQPMTNTGVAMLKRGNMALEDGDWTSADKFFEEVLNQDAECAEAYLGKTMVQQRTRSLEALMAKRLNALANPAKKEVSVTVKNITLEREIATRWELPGYLEKVAIMNLFQIHNSYQSTTQARKQQLADEKKWFEQDRNMSRALRYANGPFKQKLAQAQKNVMDQLEKNIQAAETADKEAENRIREKYQGLLKQVEAKAEELRKEAEEKREADYQRYVSMVEEAIKRNIRNPMEEAKKKLLTMGNYKDSEDMVRMLQGKIDAIDAAIAEKHRRAEEEKRYAKEVREAYAREVPQALERPQVEEERSNLVQSIATLRKNLKSRSGLIFCILFTIIGAVEFIVGMDEDETLAIIGFFCLVGFGIATIAILANRRRMRKQIRVKQKELALVQSRLEAIDGCMNFNEFARVYKLRQTEEGRAQLEEEENERKRQEEQARLAAKRAKKKKLVKRLIIITVVLLLIAGAAFAGWFYFLHYLPGEQLKTAEELIAAGKYQQAYDILYGLDYGNSQELRDEIAKKGKYAITGAVLDFDNYKLDDYHYWITYTDHGLPLALYMEEENGQTQLPSNLKPVHQFAYTFDENGNLRSCVVYTKRTQSDLPAAVPEGEVWFTGNPYYLDAEITFYDSPEATVAFLPGEGHTMDFCWYDFDTGIKFRNVQSYRRFHPGTGNVELEFNYEQNGMLTGVTYEEDDQGRPIGYYWEDSVEKTVITYNEDGTIEAIRTLLDRYDENSYFKDALFYEYVYENGNLVGWYEYPNRETKFANKMDVYIYDSLGRLQTVELHAKGKYSLELHSEYTFTYTWLDYDALEAEAEERRQEELRKQEEARQEEERKRQEELERMNAAYDAAAALADQGRTAEAAIAFSKLADFSDAQERCLALWRQRGVQTFAAARAHVVMLKENGTVDATGAEDHDRCEVGGWTGVVSVYAVNGQTFGLRLDGTVLATGYNEYGQCDVQGWEDIIALDISNFHTVGLRADGTVVATGDNEYGQCDVSDWTDIVAVSANDYHTVGLRADGTVVAAGDNEYGQCNVAEWTDIVAICTSDTNTYGLRADGTVVAVGDNSQWQCEVGHWKNIVEICADTGYVAGLCSDGTVWANSAYNQAGNHYWENIVAVDTNNGRIMGLCADGTVLSRGNNEDGQGNVEGWTDVVAISLAEFQTVGLTSDGRLLVATYYTDDYDFDKFTGVSIP